MKRRDPFFNRSTHAFGGGGGGSTQSTVSTVKLPPEITSQIPPFISATKQFVNQPFTPYTGQLVADFGPDDYAYFKRIRNNFINPFNADDLDYFNRVRNSEFLTERANPFFEEQLDIGRRRLGEEYQERIAPGLNTQFALSNAFGGSAFQEATGRSQREFARQLGEYETESRAAEVERRRAERFAAEGRLGEIGSLQRQRRDQVLQQLGSIGGVQRQQQQQLLQALYQQFIRRQDYPERQFNAYRDAIAALTGGAPRSTSATTITDQEGDTGQAISQGIGTAASTAALGYLAYLAFCWVAVVLYGDTDTRTHAARLWVARNNNWFTRLYRKRGARWAAYLERHPWQKPVWKLCWDVMARSGFKQLKEWRFKQELYALGR